MAYQVGIDLGTTSTTAAVCRADGTTHVVPLEGPTGAVTSAVYLGADGALVVGEAAERRALSDPGRLVRQLVRRIGDGTPLLVGHEPVEPGGLAARFLARLVDDVARHENGVASRVAVTHPSSWGPHRLGSLRAALAEHGLGSAVLVPEPVAAAHATVAQVGRDGVVGVYDLGGGRFEAALVRRTPGGFALAGPPEEIDRFGGADLDDVVFDHVRTALGPAWEALDATDPDVLAAVGDLRRACTAAKEALSRDTEVLVPVALPGLRTEVRLGRAEFEETIRPAVAETVEAMCRVIDAGGTEARPAAVVLVGGSSRIPLVPQMLGEVLGRDVTVAPDPVGAVAIGAALLAAPGAAAEPTARPVGADGEGARVDARGTGPRSGAPMRPGRPENVVAVAGAAPRPRPGPGTMPFELRRPAADPPAAEGPPPVDGAADPAADAPFGGTTVLPVARPPKQARPFAVDPTPAAAPSRPRRLGFVAACVLALAVLGAVVAMSFGSLGTDRDPGVVSPASVRESGVPASTSVVPPVTAEPAPPARPAAPPPARRTRQGAPPPAPPRTSAAPTPPPTTETTRAGTTTTAPPTTDDPAPAGDKGDTGTGAGTGDGGTGGGGAGSGDGGAAPKQPAAAKTSAAAAPAAADPPGGGASAPADAPAGDAPASSGSATA